VVFTDSVAVPHCQLMASGEIHHWPGQVGTGGPTGPVGDAERLAQETVRELKSPVDLLIASESIFTST
jgi:hypothetical protein